MPIRPDEGVFRARLAVENLSLVSTNAQSETTEGLAFGWSHRHRVPNGGVFVRKTERWDRTSLIQDNLPFVTVHPH